MTDYNGWKNKETWLVNVWLGDNLAMMQEDGEKITADLIENMTLEYAELLIGSADDPATAFMGDMLNCALGEIDYRELAAHFQDTLEGEDD